MVDKSAIISSYFPDLTATQLDQFRKLAPLYEDLNQKINVVSRKDIGELYVRHVLHSLAIAKFMTFKEDTELVDVGTGGGFPGIPLAILFPQCRFLLIDGTAKKIKVVNAVIEALGLENAVGMQKRSEELRHEFDFVLTRAVTRLNKLLPITRHLISKKHHNTLPNGILCLKGGDLEEEISEVARQEPITQVSLTKWFNEPFFETKSILYVQG